MALHRYEPTLRDIYVEGRSDARLIRWFLAEQGLTAQVYAIDDRVEFTDGERDSAWFDSGARGRVLSLATHATRSLDPQNMGLTCVVDADFGRVVGPEPLGRTHLLLTDGAAMECYALSERPLTKLLRIGLGVDESISALDVLDALKPALLDLFAAKAVLYAIDVKCVRDPVRMCSLRTGGSGADIKMVLSRSLNTVPKNERIVSADDAAGWACTLRATSGFHTNVGRGHDIAPLLAAYLGLSGPLAAPEAIEAAMLTSLEPTDLASEPMFVALRQRVST